jgi:hypothetical protein
MRQLADVRQVFHSERIFFLAQEFINGLVETFGMEPVDFRCVDAQGAVHEDGHARELAGKGQLMQRIHDLLGATHRKGRNNYFSHAIERFANQSSDFIVRIGFGSMLPSPVGALHLQKIDRLNRLRISQNIIGSTSLEQDLLPV